MSTLPPTELGDEDLVVALRAGDDAAFVALVRRHHGALARLARALAAADAERLLRATWRAFLETPIAGPVRLALISHLLALADAPIPRTRPDAALRAIQRLPIEERRVVLLRDGERLGAGEVEALLGLSATEQRRLLHRGRRAITAALAA
jgi:DNA-directed RNA polymerase specialized sigma24 family protein